MNLKDRAKKFGNLLPFMEGREKGEQSKLVDEGVVTIEDYGFLNGKDDNGDDSEYVCYTIREDKENFYFGSSVLTNNIKELDEEGFGSAIRKEGLPMKLSNRKSRSTNRNYVAVEFHPTV